MSALRCLFAVLLSAALGWNVPAQAADLDAPLILVAKPKLRGDFYGESILIAMAVGDAGHVGFIINRPTQVTLGRLFPEHGPSQKVPDPIYLGGPLNPQFVFALVQRGASPGGRSFQMAPDLFLAMDAETVDRIIEAEPARARFFAGLVAWRPGELRAEMERGLWYALEAEPELVLRKQTEGMWEELLMRSEHRANGI